MISYYTQMQLLAASYTIAVYVYIATYLLTYSNLQAI